MPWFAKEIEAAARRAELVGFDVDGVLTDGGLIYLPSGEEAKRFHSRDGHAIKMALRGGLAVVFITGRRSEGVERRARELGIEEVHQGAGDKWAVMADLLERRGLAPEQAAFMGDDVVDLPILRRVGLALAPADAAQEVLDVAAWIATSKGGCGAAAEALRLILKSRGIWDDLMARYAVDDSDLTRT